jgi:hypothetical protein
MVAVVTRNLVGVLGDQPRYLMMASPGRSPEGSLEDPWMRGQPRRGCNGSIDQNRYRAGRVTACKATCLASDSFFMPVVARESYLRKCWPFDQLLVFSNIGPAP